jgi:hypothetical protein
LISVNILLQVNFPEIFDIKRKFKDTIKAILRGYALEVMNREALD